MPQLDKIQLGKYPNTQVRVGVILPNKSENGNETSFCPSSCSSSCCGSDGDHTPPPGAAGTPVGGWERRRKVTIEEEQNRCLLANFKTRHYFIHSYVGHKAAGLLMR